MTQEQLQRAMRLAARRSLRNKWAQGCAQVLDAALRPQLQVVYYRGHKQPWEFIACDTHHYVTDHVLRALKGAA
jgi:hypothetical protein